jgi:hypothetical protein
MDLIPFLLVLSGIAVILGILDKGNDKPQPTASGWRILHSKGMPAAPTPTGTGFTVTVRPGQVLNYVVRQGPRIDSATFTVSGSFAPVEQPDAPPLVSLIAYVGYTRYYSRQSAPLVAGTHTLANVSWITVDGQPAPPPNADRAGVVFGQEAGRGHGVIGDGTITVEVVP